MKLLLDFINTKNIEKSGVASLLKIPRNELLILRLLTKKFIEDIEQLPVTEIINSLFRVKLIEKRLIYAEDIKSLYSRGLITLNMAGFFAMDLLKKETSNHSLSTLQVLNSAVSLNTPFLQLLETGKFYNRTISEEPYNNSYEYIEDQIKRVAIYIERAENRLFGSFNEQIKECESAIKDRVEKSDINLPLQNILNNKNLSEKEEIILLAILGEEYSVHESINSYRSVDNLLQLISLKPYEKFQNRSLFDEDSTLSKEGLIEFETTIQIVGENKSVNSEEIYLSDEVLREIESKDGTRGKRRKEALQKVVDKQNLFELIKPKDSLDDVVLPMETRDVLNRLVKQLDKRVVNRLVKWGLKEKGSGVSARIIFHGSPGTGKTMTAVSLAKSLKREVLHFDCSKILSMYVGESEKNVRNIFDTYKKIVKESGKEPLLLLNEADQFLTSRSSDLSSSTTQMYNQMQNIFLEQIENFDGVLVATTNLLENIDKAFSRRFNYKVEFKLPSKKERFEIWKKHLPKNAELEEGFSIEKLSEYKLSGGQIDLVVKNCAYEIATRESPVFATADFIREIEMEKSSTFESDRVMGFLKK